MDRIYREAESIAIPLAMMMMGHRQRRRPVLCSPSLICDGLCVLFHVDVVEVVAIVIVMGSFIGTDAAIDIAKGGAIRIGWSQLVRFQLVDLYRTGMSTATEPATAHSIRITIKMKGSCTIQHRAGTDILMDSLSIAIGTTLTVTLCVTTGTIIQRRSNDKGVSSWSGSATATIDVGTVYSVTCRCTSTRRSNVYGDGLCTATHALSAAICTAVTVDGLPLTMWAMG